MDDVILPQPLPAKAANPDRKSLSARILGAIGDIVKQGNQVYEHGSKDGLRETLRKATAPINKTNSKPSGP
jgi:hypothetical protein